MARTTAATRLQPADVLGCKALYEQVLRDALTSLKHPLRQFDAASKRQRNSSADTIRRLDALQRWFLRDSEQEPFSFVRCCAVLSLDPTAVRDRLRAQHLLEPPAQVVAARQGKQGRKPADVRRAA